MTRWVSYPAAVLIAFSGVLFGVWSQFLHSLALHILSLIARVSMIDP